jgi:hypothetical protein
LEGRKNGAKSRLKRRDKDGCGGVGKEAVDVGRSIAEGESEFSELTKNLGIRVIH